MPIDKAPGPDGFNGLFVKRCWSIISTNFILLVNRSSMMMLVKIAVMMMMATVAFRRHRRRGGEGPPSSSSSLTSSLDRRKVSPLVLGLHGMGGARVPPRLDLSLCLSIFLRFRFFPFTVSYIPGDP